MFAPAQANRGPAMAETKPLTAYWMHDVIRISEPLTIGKHAWRLVQYRGLKSRYVIDKATRIGWLVEMPAIFVDYEWRRRTKRTTDGSRRSTNRSSLRPGWVASCGIGSARRPSS